MGWISFFFISLSSSFGRNRKWQDEKLATSKPIKAWPIRGLSLIGDNVITSVRTGHSPQTNCLFRWISETHKTSFPIKERMMMKRRTPPAYGADLGSGGFPSAIMISSNEMTEQNRLPSPKVSDGWMLGVAQSIAPVSLLMIMMMVPTVKENPLESTKAKDTHCHDDEWRVTEG